MDADTLVALRGSIAKWQRIVEGHGTDQGPYNCPLCAKFNKAFLRTFVDPIGCEGCPVQEKSGKPGCLGTPYETIEELYEVEGMPEDEREDKLDDACKAELAFLISLLPEGESP